MAIKTASKFSVISAINWHTYQEIETEKGQQKGQQRTGRRSGIPGEDSGAAC